MAGWGVHGPHPWPLRARPQTQHTAIKATGFIFASPCFGLFILLFIPPTTEAMRRSCMEREKNAGITVPGGPDAYDEQALRITSAWSTADDKAISNVP